MIIFKGTNKSAQAILEYPRKINSKSFLVILLLAYFITH